MNAPSNALRASEEVYLSYATPLILARLARPEPIVAPEAEACSGAVVLIDVERFSSFAERMSSRGSEGVEQVATRINESFASAVEAIERYGGIAHGFPGDSVIALWTTDSRSIEDATLLAARCTLELLDSHRDSELPFKAGLAAGDMQVAHVGGIEGRLALLLSGDPLDQMGRAEERSSRGRLIVADSAWRLLAPHAMATALGDGYFEINSIRSAPPASAAMPLDPCPIGTVEAARAYLPAALLRQLDAGHGAWLGEFREVTTVFIRIATTGDARADDVAGVQEAFREVQRSIYRHGGDIMRFAHDDKGLAILAVFGLPPAPSEGSAARAVAASLLIEREAPRFGFRCRIGVATGRVFCGTLGAPRRREYSVVGSTPNLAARLMQSLEAGVLCDSASARAAAGTAAFLSAGRLRPKGFPDPIEVFRPGTASRAELSPGAGPAAHLIGRDKESRRLREWIEDVARRTAERRAATNPGSAFSEHASNVEPRRGCLAVVQGEAGVGKTTLLREAIRSAAHGGLEVVHVACEAVQATSLYATWARILVRLLQLDDTATPSERTRRIVEAMREASISEELAPLAAPVLDADLEDNETTREMSGAVRGDNLLALLTRLVTHLVTARRDNAAGVLLVLEDVHWLDPASWELLGVVTRALDASTLGILATLRSETAPAYAQWNTIVSGAETERIALSPLTREETRELAHRLLHASEISPQLLQLTYARTRGNPFFCEQLLTALAESGLAGVESGVAVLRVRNPEQAESVVPHSVAAVVTSRLDRLPAPIQLTLKAASVIGARFRMDVLRTIHPMQLDEAVLRDHLASAVELGLVDDADPGAGMKAFRHAITCDVAYDLLLVSQKRQLHREIAEYLGRGGGSPADQAVLFYHWRRSGDEKRALEHVDHAGAEAMRNGDYHAVAELYGYALQTEAERPASAATTARASLPREAFWSAHLGQAQVAIGLHEVARSNLEMALEMLGERPGTGRIALGGGIVREALRQLAHRLLRARLEGSRAGEAEKLALAANTYEQLGYVYYSAGETMRGLFAALRILNLSELAGLPALMAQSCAVMSLTASVVGIRRIGNLYDRRALRLARECDDPLAQAYVGWVTGLRAAGEARWGLVAMRTDAARRQAESAGDRRVGIMCLQVLAWTHYVRGDHAHACELAERQLAIAAESNNRLWEAWALCGLSEALVMAGDYAAAIRSCQRCLDVLQEESDRGDEIRATGLLAVCYLKTSRFEEAIAVARRGLDLITRHETTSFSVYEGFAGVCDVLLSLAEDARARTRSVPITLRRDLRRSIDALARFARTFPMGRARLHVMRARLSSLESSSTSAGREFQRAFRTADELGMPYEKGVALLAAARSTSLDTVTRRRSAEEAVAVLAGGEALREANRLVEELAR